MEEMLAPYKSLYRVIEGRTGRREYWMFVLLACALHIVPFALFLFVFGGIGALDPEQFGGAVAGLGMITLILLVPLYFIIGLTWLALAAASVRRLHDVGLTGWIYLALYVLLFIPFINFLAMIAYIVLMALPGSPGPNKYGSHPDHQDTGTVFQ